MKSIKVVAAVITRINEGRTEVFATQRGYGEFKDGWEFPGGKIEPEESPNEAIVREIHEELDVIIAIDEFFYTVEYDYPNFHLSMDCFLSHIEEGEPVLIEHEAAKWLAAEDIDKVNWLPADIEVVEMLKERLF